MSWFGSQRRMYLTGLVEEFLKDGSISREGFVFLADECVIGCLIRVYLFCPDSGLLKGSGFQPGFLGLPCAFHRVVLLY